MTAMFHLQTTDNVDEQRTDQQRQQYYAEILTNVLRT